MILIFSHLEGSSFYVRERRQVEVRAVILAGLHTISSAAYML